MTTAQEKLKKFEIYATKEFKEKARQLEEEKRQVARFCETMRARFVSDGADLHSHLIAHKLIGDGDWIDFDMELYDAMNKVYLPSRTRPEDIGRSFVKSFFVENEDLDGEEYISQIEIVFGTIRANQSNIPERLKAMAKQRRSFENGKRRRRSGDADSSGECSIDSCMEHHIKLLFELIGQTAEATEWYSKQSKK